METVNFSNKFKKMALDDFRKNLKSITKDKILMTCKNNKQKILDIKDKVRKYEETRDIKHKVPFTKSNESYNAYRYVYYACDHDEDIIDKMCEFVFLLCAEDLDLADAIFQLYRVSAKAEKIIRNDDILLTIISLFITLFDDDKNPNPIETNGAAHHSHHCNCDCHSQKTKDKSKKKNNIDFKSALKWLENNVAFGNITVSEQEAITLFNFFNSKQVRELVTVHGVHPLPNGIWWTRLQQYNPTNLKYAFAAPCGDGTMSIVLMFDPNTMDWVFTKEFSNMLA